MLNFKSKFIFSVDEMDQADNELKETIRKIWPLQAKKAINKLLPPDDGMNINSLKICS